jgi:hypothetical protein
MNVYEVTIRVQDGTDEEFTTTVEAADSWDAYDRASQMRMGLIMNVEYQQ